MDYQIKKPVVVTVLSALVMFVAAGLWNLVLFPRFGVPFEAGIFRQSPIFPMIIIGYLILATVIIYIGCRARFSPRPLWHWVITGALVMETAFGFSGIVLQANYNFPSSAIPLDLAWYAVEGALGGYVAFLFSIRRTRV